MDWQSPPCPSRATLTGRYCTVLPVDVDLHSEELYAANGDDSSGKNWTYLPYGPFASFADYRKWLQSISSNDDPLLMAILDAALERAVGVAAYLRIQPNIGVIEIGHLNFSRRLQRTPAATEAIYLMIRQVFQLGYRRCEWKCDALNEGSRRAASRLGFRFEGIFRQATVYKGRSRDSAWFSIIDSEWPSLEDAFAKWLATENFDEQGQQRTRLSELTGPLS